MPLSHAKPTRRASPHLRSPPASRKQSERKYAALGTTRCHRSTERLDSLIKSKGCQRCGGFFSITHTGRYLKLHIFSTPGQPSYGAGIVINGSLSLPPVSTSVKKNMTAVRARFVCKS